MIPEPPDELAGLLSLALFKVREQQARIQELEEREEILSQEVMGYQSQMMARNARIQELEAELAERDKAVDPDGWHDGYFEGQ